MRNEVGHDIGVFNSKKVETRSVDSLVAKYKSYLKSKYLEKEMPDYGKWPPSTSKKYVNLAVIEKVRLSHEEAEEKSKDLTYGDVSKIMRKGDIQLADIATPDEDSVLPKFVLVEGAPGVGKTTFAWKACRKWAKGTILQDYELVILVRLRDLSIRKATCLGDLIQYPRDPNVHQKVIEEITKTGGKGVLLLLEGYDELPASLREEGSLFRNVIKGDLFDEGTVVVTSRHWASEPFLLPYYDTKRPVSKHIEILGFNRENIQDYLSLMLKEEPSLLQDITQYLEVNPHIHSMMYIPLNCAIILEMYKNSKKESSPIPTTMTELYSSLIRSLLLRHMNNLAEYKGKFTKLTNFRNLPECIKSHFDNIASLAYKGICKKDQQIIFSQDEIPSGLDTLGLMQSSMELHVDIGTEKSFNFLHLTIQEFLAAHHLLTYSLDDQAKLFCSSNHNSESVLLRFLAGLSPLALESALTHTTHPLTKNGLVTFEVIHQMFEANKIKVLQQPLTFDDRIFHPYQYYMLGSVIANAREWKIIIRSTRKKYIQMFVAGISTCKEGYKLSLCIQMSTFASNNSDLQELCSAPIILETLKIKHAGYISSESVNYTIRFNEGIDNALCVFFNKLSEGSPLLIKHLQLAGILFHNNTSEKVELFLMNSRSTTSLTVEHCEFNPGISVPGKQAYTNVKKLKFNMCHFREECNAMLKDNKMLIEFHLTSQFGFTYSLAKSLCANDTLKRLVLECEHVERRSEHVFDIQPELWLMSSRIEDMSAQIIMKNKSLTELSLLCYPEFGRVESDCTLGKALCENNTLEKLELAGVSFSVQGAVAFASMLRENTSLKELSLNIPSLSTSLKSELSFLSTMSLRSGQIRRNSEWIEILVTLSSSLTHNRTLLKLCITLPPASIQHCDEVISACEKDSRLHIQ